jgi:hypothetical protein
MAFGPSFVLTFVVGIVQLSSPFRSLSCIARDKYALVADCIFSYNAEVHSEMNFIRLLHDWEVDFVFFFFSVLYILLRVREMKISAVGFLPKDNLLRSNFTKFSPMLSTFSLGRTFGGVRIL